MGLFNEQTQYTADVSQANNQVMSQASEAGAYMAGLIQADAVHRQSNAKLIDDLGPLLSSFGKICMPSNKLTLVPNIKCAWASSQPIGPTPIINRCSGCSSEFH